MAFLSEYGLFLLQFVTVVGVLLFAVLLIISATRKGQEQDGLSVVHINKMIEQRADTARRTMLGKRDSRKLERERNKQRKAERKQQGSAEPGSKRRVFVLDFKGDIRATATGSLREEISTIIGLAENDDEVLLRLENSGGAVHEHGLAASQLARLRARGIHLTIAVDKVAASGGYLMACVADRIVAAPFAIIGSIGVLMQLPNFHRMLEQKGIDFEQITAGKYKRTLTLFGENSEEGREKMKEELAEVHELFQRQIRELRPEVDLDQVATGEHWYGSQALDLKLIDEIGTSDDYLLKVVEDADVYRLSHSRPKKFVERLLQGAEGLLYR